MRGNRPCGEQLPGESGSPVPTRKRLVAQRRRWERACKRAAAASVIFCERGGMTECMRKARSKTGLFEWSAVHSDVAETVGFEPTCLSLDKTISSRSRYDHFDTSPSINSPQMRELSVISTPLVPGKSGEPGHFRNRRIHAGLRGIGAAG